MADTSTALILPVLPIPDGVVFPGTVVTITADSAEAREAIDAAAAPGDHSGQLLLVPRLDGRFARVGTIAKIEQRGELPTGQSAVIVRALGRGRIGVGVAGDQPGLVVEVEPLVDAHPNIRTEGAMAELKALAEGIAERRRSRRLPEILRTVNDPGALADAVTGWSDASTDHKITVLELTEIGARLDVVIEWARSYLAELSVTEKIRSDVTEGMERQQRDFLLRQQLSAIRKELGDEDSDTQRYQARLDELGDKLPPAAREAIERELGRLERSGAQSPEQSWLRTWLDRALELPWGETTADQLDIVAARSVLDADHTGLDDVKDRIIEFLAVRKLRSERALNAAEAGAGRPPAVGGSGASRRGDGAIIVLVGPPGVGKTSLGESVATAMNRRFVRLALGGVRDEAEIRGHRRTYVGAQPGRIVRAITESGSMNPVVLLDEVDKMSAGGWSGDPTAALLEVLDPAQNHTFRDHYLELELDLSDVVFVATANQLESIPGPLLDRMELVRLDGYCEDEKVIIASTHLMPRQLERNGLRPDEIDLPEATIREIVTGYTREAGVRSLERELGKLLRKLAARVAEGFETPITVEPSQIPQYLGRRKVHDEVADRVRDTPGVATGLAVTGLGGDILFIEVLASVGEPRLVLTGQLGDVMKESAQIALSWVRTHAERLGIAAEALDRTFHVHVPAGAVPKDGPSAGVTMTTALVSVLTGRPVRPEVGMTGEVTLQGRVLPIGGVKQKVLAAHRAGLTEVIVPKRNEPDLDDVPESIRDQMRFHPVTSLDEVLAVALAG